jgi:hypothetical protein
MRLKKTLEARIIPNRVRGAPTRGDRTLGRA